MLVLASIVDRVSCDFSSILSVSGDSMLAIVKSLTDWVILSSHILTRVCVFYSTDISFFSLTLIEVTNISESSYFNSAL